MENKTNPGTGTDYQTEVEKKGKERLAALKKFEVFGKIVYPIR
jgi:hypothetical protein